MPYIYISLLLRVTFEMHGRTCLTFYETFGTNNRVLLIADYGDNFNTPKSMPREGRKRKIWEITLFHPKLYPILHSLHELSNE